MFGDNSILGFHYWGESIIESGGTGLNINCHEYCQFHDGIDSAGNYNVKLNAGAYVSGYNVGGWDDVTISSGTTVFNMNIISGFSSGAGDTEKTFTINSGAYVSGISGFTADIKHNLIIKSGGTAYAVVSSSFNITSETGADVTYV